MKIILAILAMLPTLAHFNVGWYKGVTTEGGECKIEFVGKTYRFNVRNPLNEVVEVRLENGESFGLVHLLKFNSKDIS